MAKTILDLQAHLAPPNYLKYLEKRNVAPYVRREDDVYSFYYGEDSFYRITKHSYDVKSKIEAMDKAGVSVQVLSTIIPGAEILDIKTGNHMARIINDDLAEVVSSHPDRFFAIATLSYRDTDAALIELERAVFKLGFKGILLFSNINGMALSDKRLWPIYETMQKYNLPIFIHPTRPVMVEEVKDYGLEPIVGYMFDTSLAALKMIFSGVFDKYPNLKVVLPHAGGVIPYLLGRIDYQSSINPDSRKHISMEPSYYIKKLYTDTVCLSRKTLEFAYEIFGASNVLFATDYPYVEMEPTIEMVADMDIPEEHKYKIFENNARKLMNI